MKKEEKIVLKTLKKGFSVNDWKDFSYELKTNELILSELTEKLKSYNIERIKELAESYPFIIKYLNNSVQLQLVNNDNFQFLSDNLQIEIIEKNNNKVKYASKENQIKFATNNPLKLSFTSPDVQRNMIETNQYYLEFALLEIQIEYAKKNIDMLCRCSNLVQCNFIKLDPNFYSKCNQEVKKNIISLNNLSPEKINVDTLETYLSYHYENLSLEELAEYKKKLQTCERNDKEQIIGYIEYLQINLSKKKL